jgi:spore coat protein U-like protein
MSKFSLNLFASLLSLFFIGETQVSATCNFNSVTAVFFGNYDVLSASYNDSAGNIDIMCDNDPWVLVTMSVNASPNSGGFNPRKMKLSTGVDLLNYNLYTTASRDTIWGDGTQGTSTVQRICFRNVVRQFPIYGRIPAGQDVSVGIYSEVLVVQINF